MSEEMATAVGPLEIPTIGGRIKAARRLRKLTQKELAARARVSQQVIGKLETGRSNATTRAVQIANALGVSPEWLVSGGIAGHPAVLEQLLSPDAEPHETAEAAQHIAIALIALCEWLDQTGPVSAQLLRRSIRDVIQRLRPGLGSILRQLEVALVPQVSDKGTPRARAHRRSSPAKQV